MSHSTGDLYDFIHRIQRQYPDWPSTFSTCLGCELTASRGTDVCVGCLQKEMTEWLISLEITPHQAAELTVDLMRGIEWTARSRQKILKAIGE